MGKCVKHYRDLNIWVGTGYCHDYSFQLQAIIITHMTEGGELLAVEALHCGLIRIPARQLAETLIPSYSMAKEEKNPSEDSSAAE